MSIKTQCHLRPAQCRCETTGKVLDRYSITLAVSGLTLEQASALLPQINAQMEGAVAPLRPAEETADAQTSVGN